MTRAPHLKPLTGLRFFAALLVVTHHFAFYDRASGLHDPISNVLNSGFVSVNLFFILSGFILAYTYVDGQGRLNGPRRDFWIARFARIYPVYLLALLIAPYPIFSSQYIATPNPVATRIASLTLTQAWLPLSATIWNPPGWTLSVEAFCYLLFPVIAIPFMRLPRRQLYVAAALLWAASMLPPLIYMAADPDHLHGHWDADTWLLRVIGMMPLLRLPEFLLGAVACRLFIMKKTKDASIRAMGRRGGMAVLCGVTAVVTLCALSLGPLVPNLLLHDGIFDPLFALLIYCLAFGEGRLASFLSLPIIVTLGEASYSLYILHWPLWTLLVHSSTGDPPAHMPHPHLFFLSYLAIAIAVSILSLRVVEQPARRAIKKAFVQRRSNQSADSRLATHIESNLW